MTTTPQIGIDIRIAQYVKLRDKIKAEDDAHKEKMKPAKEALEKLNGVLLQALNSQGAESIRSEYGTAYVTVKKSASLEDADAFMRHVIGSEQWDLLDRKANATAVEQFVQENGALPPGVKFTTTNVVGVRRS